MIFCVIPEEDATKIVGTPYDGKTFHSGGGWGGGAAVTGL